MKKKKLKLGLKKVSVSNLSSIKGGGSNTCPVLDTSGYTDDYPETWESTCYTGRSGCDDPTGYCNYTDRCSI